MNPVRLPLRVRCHLLPAALTVLSGCAAIRPDPRDCPGDPSVAVSFR